MAGGRPLQDPVVPWPHGGARARAARRWAVVGALVVMLLALPPLIRPLPASDADISAAELRTRALATARSASPATPCRPGWRCRSPTSSARSPTCSAAGRTCASGGAGRPTTASTSSPRPGRSARTAGRPAPGRGSTSGRPPPGPPPTPSTCPPARRAAQLPGPPAAVRGHRRRARPDRRPPGRRPRRPRPAADPAARGRLGAPRRRLDRRATAACRCRCRCSRRAPPRTALDTRFLDLDLAVPRRDVTAFTPPPGATVREGRRPRWCWRPAGGSAPSGCPTSSPGCRAGGSRACRPASASTGAASRCWRSPRCPAAWPGPARRAVAAPTPSSTSSACGSPPGRWALMLVEPPGHGPTC